MDVFFGNVLQVYRVNVGRIVNVKLHSGRRHHIIDVRRYLEYSAPPGHAPGTHRRRDRKADGLLRALRVGDHKICRQRIQPSLPTLHGSIERFQIYADVGSILGHFSLLLAFILALVQVGFPIL